jgi:hypothetical protein
MRPWAVDGGDAVYVDDGIIGPVVGLEPENFAVLGEAARR